MATKKKARKRLVPPPWAAAIKRAGRVDYDAMPEYDPRRNFVGFVSGRQVYPRARKRAGSAKPWVQTYEGPTLASAFALSRGGGGLPLFVRDKSDGEILIIDDRGKTTPHGFVYLVAMMTDEQHDVLEFSGVNGYERALSAWRDYAYTLADVREHRIVRDAVAAMPYQERRRMNAQQKRNDIRIAYELALLNVPADQVERDLASLKTVTTRELMARRASRLRAAKAKRVLKNGYERHLYKKVVADVKATWALAKKSTKKGG